MQRHGQIIQIKPGYLEKYRLLHAAAWPEVLERIGRCNIRRNQLHFHNDGILFASFELQWPEL